MIALIPKSNLPNSFEDFRSISLCNCIYKIIGKVISTRIKKDLCSYISGEQFGFLPGRQIHDVVGVIQEGLHSIQSKHLKSVVLKIDLSKAYDWVNQTYLQVLLSQMGFAVPFITWVMGSLTSVSFAILINGVASSSFRLGHGLRQGFPLAPLLFLIVVEGLGRAILDARDNGYFTGLTFGNGVSLTHVLFVLWSLMDMISPYWL